MRQYDLSAAAREDLLDLAEHASEYSPRSRDALTDTLVDCFEALESFPNMGRNRDELAPGLQSFMIPRIRVTVYYTVLGGTPNLILIARLLRHGREAQPSDFR